MLLHEVKGPTSFGALKTVEDNTCLIYQEAGHRHGLLDDDSHWKATLTEAVVAQSPFKLRSLFGIMLQTV